MKLVSEVSMSNLFCDKCNKLMKLEKNELICSCGFKKIANLTCLEVPIKNKEIGAGVLGEKEPVNFPHTCSKCGHGGCEVVDLGAAYSDESNVYLYICDRCGYVDRQADGSSNG